MDGVAWEGKENWTNRQFLPNFPLRSKLVLHHLQPFLYLGCRSVRTNLDGEAKRLAFGPADEGAKLFGERRYKEGSVQGRGSKVCVGMGRRIWKVGCWVGEREEENRGEEPLDLGRAGWEMGG
jgi:hypothetical protein